MLEVEPVGQRGGAAAAGSGKPSPAPLHVEAFVGWLHGRYHAV